MANRMWELSILPNGRKSVECKWVFCTNRDAFGEIMRHKAQLATKGYFPSSWSELRQDVCPWGQIHHDYMHSHDRYDYGLANSPNECKDDIFEIMSRWTVGSLPGRMETNPTVMGLDGISWDLNGRTGLTLQIKYMVHSGVDRHIDYCMKLIWSRQLYVCPNATSLLIVG